MGKGTLSAGRSNIYSQSSGTSGGKSSKSPSETCKTGSEDKEPADRSPSIVDDVHEDSTEMQRPATHRIRRRKRLFRCGLFLRLWSRRFWCRRARSNKLTRGMLNVQVKESSQARRRRGYSRRPKDVYGWEGCESELNGSEMRRVFRQVALCVFCRPGFAGAQWKHGGLAEV